MVGGIRKTAGKKKGLFWELNPGPLAPETRIIPLDQAAKVIGLTFCNLDKEQTLRYKYNKLLGYIDIK